MSTENSANRKDEGEVLLDQAGPVAMLTGCLLTSADALQDGFLTEIVEEAQLTAHVAAIARQISSLAPLTIWAAKEGRRRLNAAEAAIDFDDVIATVYGSADFAEGVQAYLAKRKSTWQGQ